jgi:hypothetical protein
MRGALHASAVMLVPILAGAAPVVKKAGSPLSDNGNAILKLTEKYASLVAMSRCPAAVLPVPPVDAGSAPWAVMLVGRHRCDLQLLQLAIKLSAQVDKTAASFTKARLASFATWNIRFSSANPVQAHKLQACSLLSARVNSTSVHHADRSPFARRS